jgi:hypothetical protein
MFIIISTTRRGQQQLWPRLRLVRLKRLEFEAKTTTTTNTKSIGIIFWSSLTFLLDMTTHGKRSFLFLVKQGCFDVVLVKGKRT